MYNKLLCIAMLAMDRSVVHTVYTTCAICSSMPLTVACKASTSARRCSSWECSILASDKARSPLSWVRLASWKWNKHGELIDFTHVIRLLRDAKRQPFWFLATIVLPIQACEQSCSFIAFCLSPVNGIMHAKHGRGASRLRAISSLWRKSSIWAKNIGNWGTGWRRLRESENGVSGAHVHRCVGMARDEVRLFCSFPRLLHLYHIQRFWLV